MTEKNKTNLVDWSRLIPVLPEAGPRRAALYAELRRLIETGAVPAGSKLPTTRDLAERLSISRGAAVAAFELLLADGFVETRTGAGTFVAGKVPQIERPAPTADSGRTPPPPALPGTLGVAVADERTVQVFRSLLMRELARPSPVHFSYGDARGGAGLRHEIARYLTAARGVRCHSDQIVVTAGVQQGLDLVIRALLVTGDPVWIEDPCYPMARAAFAGAGMQLVGVPVDDEGLDCSAGIALAPAARAVYVTPSHQFPLGVTMTMARRLALIEWARQNEAFIIEDDYDSEFRFAGPPLTSLQGIDGAGRVIYLGTFSKALFPGLRVGYMVLPEALIAPVLSVRDRVDRFPSTLAEAPLTALLAEGHFAAHIRRARKRVKAARDGLVAALASGPIVARAPDQGLHLIASAADGIADATLLATARIAGLGGRALSTMYLGPARRQGLVIGFSGFSPDDLAGAAERWIEELSADPALSR